MKRIYILLFALCLGLCVTAQTKSKGSQVALNVFVDDLESPFPASAKQSLERKLTTLLARNGLASSSYNNRFYITAMATPLTKDILPGPPMQIAYRMEFSFYIADIEAQLVFSSTAIEVTGIGPSEAKAYMSALSKINVNSKELQVFVQEGKAKIVAYYDKEATNIFAKAYQLAQDHQYGQALFLVSAIPSECKKYDQALVVGGEIFDQYNAYTCNIELAAARAAWVAEQNTDGAIAAGEHLSKIYPDAGCYDEAMVLYNEIREKVLSDEAYARQQEADNLQLEQQKIDAMRKKAHFAMQTQQATQEAEQARIEAWRAVGGEYAVNATTQVVQTEGGEGVIETVQASIKAKFSFLKDQVKNIFN